MTTVANGTREDWLLDAVLAPAYDGDPIRPLYDAAARGELALPFCGACGLALELEQHVCDDCANNERIWRPVPRHGVVHAATLMYRREPGLVRGDAPYPIVDVELESGHRLVMTTLAQTATAPNIGSAVRIGFRRLGGVAIPAIDTMEDPE
jgi:uncharacterized OB-fold protein